MVATWKLQQRWRATYSSQGGWWGDETRDGVQLVANELYNDMASTWQALYHSKHGWQLLSNGASVWRRHHQWTVVLTTMMTDSRPEHVYAQHNTTLPRHECLWHRGARLIIHSITENVKTQTTLYTSTHTAVTVTTHWPSSWSSYFSTSNSLVRKVATVLKGKVKGFFKDFQGCVFHVSSPSLSSGVILTAFKHLYYSCCILTKK